MNPKPANPIIVAIDRTDPGEATALAESLSGSVGMLKIGLELFWSQGPAVVRAFAAMGPVFVDAKLHDIPTTVEHASANIARLGVAMLNVHALGGEAMMQAAREGADRGAREAGVAKPLVIAVTVLSSLTGEELASPASLAFEAKASGLDGVVVSGDDVREVRAVCGDGFVLVVPGIRPAGTNGDDQARILTPAEAVEKGADYLVVGRPITAAPDPVAVARSIAEQIA